MEWDAEAPPMELYYRLYVVTPSKRYKGFLSARAGTIRTPRAGARSTPRGMVKAKARASRARARSVGGGDTRSTDAQISHRGGGVSRVQGEGQGESVVGSRGRVPVGVQESRQLPRARLQDRRPQSLALSSEPVLCSALNAESEEDIGWTTSLFQPTSRSSQVASMRGRPRRFR